MTSVKYIVIVLLAAALFAAPVRAQEAPVRIAVCNPVRIFQDMKERKDLQAKMQADQDAMNAENTKRQDNIRKLKEARDELKPEAPQYNQRNDELIHAAIEYKAWGETMQQEIQRKQKQQIASLFEKIEQAVSEVAVKDKLDLVIAEQRPDTANVDQMTVDQLRGALGARNLLYAAARVDISSEVVATLDAKYAQGASPPAPGQ